MTLDLDELERVAKAATPGPWRVEGFVKRGGAIAKIISHGLNAQGDGPAGYVGDTYGEADAKFVAALNPAVCLALISRARGAERLEAEKSEWARIQIGNGMEIGRHIATLVALQRAARHLLDACYAADAAEELSMEIDGSLLDALKAFVPDDPEAWGKLSALNEGGPALSAQSEGLPHEGETE